MDQNVEEIAEALSRRFSLDVQRVRDAIALTARFQNRSGKVHFFPDLSDALSHLSPEEALGLFERLEPLVLSRRVHLTEYLGSDRSLSVFFNGLLCNIRELERLTEAFLGYLEGQRDTVVATGSPQEPFLPRCWQFDSLSGFYRPPNEGRNGDLSDGLRIHQAREKLFVLKAAALKEVLQALRWRTADGLWERFLKHLSGVFTYEEVESCLRRDQSFPLMETVGEGNGPLWEGRAFSDLLLALWYYEKELTVGTMAKTRELLGDLVLPSDGTHLPRLVVDDYFVGLRQGWGPVVDPALDRFWELAGREDPVRRQFAERVQEAFETRLCQDVVVQQRVQRRYVQAFQDCMESFAQWTKAHQEQTGFPPQLVLSDGGASSQQENEFLHMGDRFRVRFAGKQVYLNAVNAVGLSYVQHLLSRPDRSLTPLELYLAVHGAPAPHNGRHSQQDETVPDLRSSPSSRFYRRSTNRGDGSLTGLLSSLKHRFDGLMAQKLDAERAGSQAGLDQVQAGFSQLAEAVIRLRDPQVDDPVGGDPLERMKRAVRQAINRAIERIGTAHEPLGRHLERSLDRRGAFGYRPERPVPWRTA